MDPNYQEIDGWLIPKEEVDAYLQDRQELKSTLYRYAMTHYDRFHDRGKDGPEGEHIYAERKKDGLEFMMHLDPNTVSHFRLWKDDVDGYLEVLHWHQLQYLELAYQDIVDPEEIEDYLTESFEETFKKPYEGKYRF